MNSVDLLLPTYVQLLTALSTWLDKAQTQLSEDAEDLLSARLASDMFPLSTQVRFACVQAQEGIYRLRGEEFPESLVNLLDEGRNAGEHPGTIEETRTRIEETISVVKSLSNGLGEIDPDQSIAHALPNGIIFDLSVEQFARDWAIAQFYFHVITAYAILRNCGIELGKADYVAHMFTYLRPGTLPQN
ncbi:MAG: DUF1993 domain-containing protein [Cyanobacteria bacterium J06648_11]